VTLITTRRPAAVERNRQTIASRKKVRAGLSPSDVRCNDTMARSAGFETRHVGDHEHRVDARGDADVLA